MRFERVFQFSVYLTLAVATLGLCSSERYFIPEILWFLIPTLALLVVAYAVEGRWSLSALASNIIGIVIAGGTGLWVARSLAEPSSQLIEHAPYPAAFLPFGGPVLMLVMLAKLFRPKQINDYWGLHVIGLMEASLGCILAGDPEFSLWLFAYMACALWSLMLFLFYREALRARHARAVVVPLRGWGAFFTLRRVVLIVALGFPLFLLTPRHANERWNLLNPSSAAGQMETGYAPQIDLTRTGPVSVSEETEFEVVAEDLNGNPKLDLNPEQRWRGAVLESYEQGRWLYRSRSRLPPSLQGTIKLPVKERDDFPDLGEGSYYLRYELDLWTHPGLLIALPVVADADQRLSIRATDRNAEWVPVFHPRDSLLMLPVVNHAMRAVRYEQIMPGTVDETMRPAREADGYLQNSLVRQSVEGIHTWTRQVLDRLVAKGRLQAADRVMAPDPTLGKGTYLLKANRAKVAKAMCEYLSSSGEFQYRLELRRSDLTADPIEDFLRNVKQGFCSHYASGLTLMLRSVGIPARVITGYRGAELQTAEDGTQSGRYIVRKSHSHSWVEALLESPDADGNPQHTWLLLDPTPSSGTTDVDVLSLTRWWTLFRGTLRDIWTGLILDYNMERQAEAMYAVSQSVASFAEDNPIGAWLDDHAGLHWAWLATVPGLAVLAWWLRRRRQRRPVLVAHGPGTDCEFYLRWLGLVTARTGIPRDPSRTPREMAELVTASWYRAPAAEIVQRACRQVVALYYRVRFGREPLLADERSAVEHQLSELHATLRTDQQK